MAPRSSCRCFPCRDIRCTVLELLADLELVLDHVRPLELKTWQSPKPIARLYSIDSETGVAAFERLLERKNR